MSQTLIPLNTARAIATDVARGIPWGLTFAYHTHTGHTKPKPNTETKASTPAALPAPKVEDVAAPKRVIPTVMAHPKGVRAVESQPTKRGGPKLEKMTLPMLLINLRRLAKVYSYDSIARHIRDASGRSYTTTAVRSWVVGAVKPYGPSIDSLRNFLISYRDARPTVKLNPAGSRNT